MGQNRIIPFGYCIENGEITVNDTECETVRRIFEMYIGGSSLVRIAQQLDVPYAVGKARWNKNMVSRILNNKRYTGIDNYPLIISTDMFLQAGNVRRCRKSYIIKDKPKAKKYDSVSKTLKYTPNEEITNTTKEIANLINSSDAQEEQIIDLIIRCANLKYEAVTEE